MFNKTGCESTRKQTMNIFMDRINIDLCIQERDENEK